MIATLNERRYQKLLGRALPVVIQSEDEYDRLLDAIRELMERPEHELGEEEGRLLELLGVLIQEYETRVHPLPVTAPHKMLAHLLKERALKPSDLWSILPRSRVSEVLAGKRGISKEQAKRLAVFFRVPVDLFL